MAFPRFLRGRLRFPCEIFGYLARGPRYTCQVFDRLYVLRYQLVHGGSTWNSSVNRNQVREGAGILGFLMPVFVDIMMDNPQVDWRGRSIPLSIRKSGAKGHGERYLRYPTYKFTAPSPRISPTSVSP